MTRSGRYRVEVPSPEYFGRLVACRDACPVHTDSGAYVRAISEGRDEDAYRIARAPNPFASVCGRVCNAPCEAACRRGAIDAPVAIRALKRFVTERFGVESGAFDAASVAPGRAAFPPSAPKVAIVGAGPAGLACAHDLALAGVRPVVFEAQRVAGGMLVLGVPEYRLPRDVVAAEIGVIEELGVEIRYGQRLGDDFTLSDLEEQGYAAVFLAIGAHKSRDLSIDGADFDGVVRAVDFLLNVNLGYRIELGRKVIVIGGGNVAFDAARSVLRQTGALAEMTEGEVRSALDLARGALAELTETDPSASSDVHAAIDAARQAKRAGASEVHVYCLEDLHEIPAAREEIEEALSEGIELHTRRGPQRIVGENGVARGVEMKRVTRVFDADGRFHPSFAADPPELIEGDSIVLAVGQASDLSWVRPGDGLKVTARGTIETDPETMATSRPDLFCGGDVAFGPRIIIHAVAEGRRAAASILHYLEIPRQESNDVVRTTRHRRHEPSSFALNRSRQAPPTVSVSRRVGLTEVESVFPEAIARAQSSRCLHCQIAPVFDGDRCVLCGGCVEICPEACLRLVDASRLVGTADLDRLLAARYGGPPTAGAGAGIVKDETRCIRCGLCAERCPTGAVTMESVEIVPDGHGADASSPQA